MSDTKKPCPGCGSNAVLLTEDKYTVPKCAGCGKPLKDHKKEKK